MSQTGRRRASWQALGTSAVVQVIDPRRLESAEDAVRVELERIDLACSRFRSDSELSGVNRSSGQTVHVGPLLAEAVELSLRAAVMTGGAVDPTIGQSLLIAGYDRDWSLMEHEVASGGCGSRSHAARRREPGLVTVHRVAGWRGVRLDARRRRLRVPAGVSLDLGAVAKALAADRAAGAAHAAARCGVLVAVGGDIAVAGSAPRVGWPVRVADSHRSHGCANGQTVTIRSGGLATSGSTVRRWRREGHELHHIIDPRTGSSARSPWRTASVAAASCVEANIAATAAVVKGADALAWLRERLLPARLVDHAGEFTCVAGWPEPQAVGR